MNIKKKKKKKLYGEHLRETVQFNLLNNVILFLIKTKVLFPQA